MRTCTYNIKRPTCNLSYRALRTLEKLFEINADTSRPTGTPLNGDTLYTAVDNYVNGNWARWVTGIGICRNHRVVDEYLSDHSGVFVDLKAGT